jgi:hypothetical protein
MKLFSEKKYEYLERTLKAAYHDRKIPELNLHWRQDIMRAIRSLGPLKTVFNPLVFAQHFSWRFVTVACLVVVMLLGYMWYSGLNPFYDVNELLLDDSVQLAAVRQAYEEF